jgi:hypothetical protein
MHQRLANEFLFRLARRALAIIAPCLREEEQRDAFSEFHMAFKEELLRYEEEKDRMQSRLNGNRPSPREPKDTNAAGKEA